MRPMFRFDVYTERHEGLKYEGSTTAVSEAKAINNVRYNTRGNYETQYNGWPWSAVNKGPATEEDRQMDMINQAQGQKRDKLHTFIEVDIDRLEMAAKRRGKKLKDVNKWMERGNSYCSQRRKYGTLSEWDIELIEANGIPREEFTKKKTLGDKVAEAVDTLRETLTGAPLRLLPVAEVAEAADTEMVSIPVDEDLRAFSYVVGESFDAFIEQAVAQRIERIQAALAEVKA